MNIVIKADNGWATFNAWVAAGYPGAPNFAHPKTTTVDGGTQPPHLVPHQPDPTRGLCRIEGCTRVNKWNGLCMKHYEQRHFKRGL